MRRTYSWTAKVSNDRGDTDGESAGTVKAGSEAEAMSLIRDWVQQDGARKGHRWTATRIELH